MNGGKPPRFPYVTAVLCAACVGAAGWTWMRYSYCWDVSPADLEGGWHLRSVLGGAGQYVRVMGSVGGEGATPITYNRDTVVATMRDPSADGSAFAVRLGLVPAEPPKRPGLLAIVWTADLGGHDVRMVHCGDHWLMSQATGSATGRVETSPLWRDRYCVNATASRFHPASVSGLVVGAMGAFVFALYLRNWLKERRAAA